MAEIANSSFLDLTAWRQTKATTVAGAYEFDETNSYTLPSDQSIIVGIMLDRKTDATDLLGKNWAERQKKLSELSSSGTLWSTYGADQVIYNSALDDLNAENATILNNKDGWVGSSESRTIWISVNASQFQSIFGQELRAEGNKSSSPDLIYWNGNLSSDQSWTNSISGLWVDTDQLYTPSITPSISTVDLPNGAQSIGNELGLKHGTLLHPNEISDLYNFPLQSIDTITATIGLIEPGYSIPFAQDENPTSRGSKEIFQNSLDIYRNGAGIEGNAKFYPNAQPSSVYNSNNYSDSSEMSLDVGVVTTISPNSTMGIYSGPIIPYDNETKTKVPSTKLPTYQTAIWDTENSPAVISSSYNELFQARGGSPFHRMYDELFIDAALANITMVAASGDSGSNGENANGVPNVKFGLSSPYAIIVGGTSITTQANASNDTTISEIALQASSNNLTVLQQLVLGGLVSLPANSSENSIFIETVWNSYHLDKKKLDPSYVGNEASTGGIDPRISTPDYQLSYDLTLKGDGPNMDIGRGVPDVAALAGGNTHYTVPNSNYIGTHGDAGTSASAPLWAALTAQIQTIFTNQGLPGLGYYNDLLYNAAAIAPGAFNDVTLGNNISSYYHPNQSVSESIDAYYGKEKKHHTTINPTGYGYQAGPDYDLTTGLGTPNGLLLARALTAIAHAQMSSDAPDVLDQAAYGSAANQHLLVQATLQQNQDFSLAVAGSSTSYAGTATNSLAWNSAFAQKTMQADFDPALVRLFDSAAQGTARDLSVAAGNSLAVTLGGSTVAASRTAMTSPFGFVDYKDTAGNGVRLARAVAIAQTAGGADDQQAVVRLRQNTTDDMTIAFYRVDDLDGTINGLAPGQTGYDAAVTGRLYTTTTGGTAVAGPGYGLYTQALLSGVDSGDLIAMMVTSGPYDKTATSVTHGFYGFSAANETVDGSPVTHLWNYGLNTWGWEGTYGGGDQDYNDLVVQLDFTSASGSGWLVQDPSTGTAGDDASYGDNGNNYMTAAAGDDTVYGAAGVDTLFGGTGDDLVSGQDSNDFLGTGAGDDFGSGGWGNDEVHGEEGNDLLFGDDGNDGVYGEDGDDLVYGGTGNDYLTGDAGNDRVFGEDGDDQVFGGGGGDDLSGGAGADTIEGGTGADLLFGNAGDDVLTGGTGADVFAFGAGDGFDRILDFVTGGAEADVIAFNGGAFADFAAVQAASRQDGSDVVIGYGAGDALTLAGVQLGSLSAANFTFA